MINELRGSVDWEITDYYENIFRGWTIEDAKKILGTIPTEI